MKIIKIVFIFAIFTPIIGFAQQQSSLDSKKVIAKYNSLDKNSDGRVTKAEAEAEGMSGPTFNKLDANKDGSISQSEFIAGLAAGYYTGGGKWE
jgi:Ca2+-binding EF-hand superfamily protein